MTRKDRLKIRSTVGFTPDQMSRLDELMRARNRKGDPTSRADLVREAVGFYLQHQPDVAGSRKAIARDLEGKIDALNGKVETLAERLEHFIEMLRNRRAGG
jgi:hypothetical protein